VVQLLVRDAERALSSDGKTMAFVAVDGAAAGLVAITDPLRSTSRAAVDAFRARGLEVVLLTGDSERAAQSIAAAAAGIIYVSTAIHLF